MNKQIDEEERIEIQRNPSDFWFACVDINVLRDNTLLPEARLIFAVMCTYASVMGTKRWPHIEDVVRDSGFCIEIVRIAYNELKEAGLLLRLWDRCDHSREEE